MARCSPPDSYGEQQMPKGPRLPTVEQIIELARDLGMDMTEAEATSYQTLMKGAVNSYRRIDALEEVKPRVKYPRDPGYRPGPEENPWNASLTHLSQS